MTEGPTHDPFSRPGPPTGAPPRVVIIGAGFGGLAAARALRQMKVQVTVVDRRNHHLFQPLLYQVAIAGLSPADIAAPIRAILRRQTNATVLLAEATDFNLADRVVVLNDGKLEYDYLVLATGGRTSYFNNDRWEEYAPGLKDLDDAVEIRRRVLLAFEAAEREANPVRRRELLTFVVVGGGPTGVELAGAIAELARFVLASDFRSIDPRETKILLIEAGDGILGTFPDDLSRSAERQLERLGVKIQFSSKVTNITQEGVYLGDTLIRAATVIWSAGVRATSLTARLGVPLDRAGRVLDRARSYLARTQRCLCDRRHGRPPSPGRPAAAWSQPGGDPDGQVCRAQHPALSRGEGARALSLFRPRDHGYHRAVRRDCRPGQLASERFPRLACLASGSYLFSDRLSKSNRGALKLGLVLFYLPAGSSPDHRPQIGCSAAVSASGVARLGQARSVLDALRRADHRIGLVFLPTSRS